MPHLAVYNIGCLQHLLFGFIPVHAFVKRLNFHQVLKGNNAKQKSYAKSFKIVLSLAYDRMPTKPQLLMYLGRIAYLINDLNSVNQCFILVIKTVTEWFSVQNSMIHACDA